MSSFESCPKCGREAKKAFSSNWFPVYKCNECKTEYCEDCGGDECPSCGSDKRSTVGKVYA
jgi:transposase-like protein